MHQRWPKHSGDTASLVRICEGLPGETAVAAAGRWIGADELPEPFDRLLVHEAHMTERLAAYHGRPVALRVLAECRRADVYRRKIVLTLAGTDRVVELGVVRIDLSAIPEAARDDILKGQRPLGAVLIDQAVLRRIQPRGYLRFRGADGLAGAFGVPVPHNIFGRCGTIHCHDVPAIELLEIVTGVAGKRDAAYSASERRP
ncbi:MAG: hypothetical protein ACE5EX_02290 [Phycisphaerae bacterium]